MKLKFFDAGRHNMSGTKQQTIDLGCTCGAVRGVATVTSSSAHRLICMCEDCQAFAHFLGRPKEILDANGGSDIVHLIPPKFSITQGKKQIRCLRLTEKGMYRWYAGCCKTPIANSMGTPKVPFV